MWTATTRGFFSAVQHRDDPALLVVRTRDYADADTLRAWYQDWLDGLATLAENMPVEVPQGLPEAAITAYQVSDYPWRVIMPRTAWGAFLAESVEDLDYGNFKDAVKAAQGPERAQVYLGVWSALLRLEDLDPMSTRQPIPWDDEPWDEYDAWEASHSETCPNCEGSGVIDTTPAGATHPALQSDTECPTCDGTGTVLSEPDEDDDDAEDWPPVTSAQVSRWLEAHQ